MVTADTWTCPRRAQPCAGRFCPQCGERALHLHDLSVLGLAEQVIEDVTRADGRVTLDTTTT